MASYDMTFGNNSGLQIGHNSGVICISAPQKKTANTFSVPDLLSPHFTGRKDELEQLREIYLNPATKGPARCILHGMPGLGKSQLALQFAVTSQREERYEYFFWLSGASLKKLDQGCLAILDNLGLDVTGDHYKRANELRRWLTTDPKWLLIIDNVDTGCITYLRDLLPQSNSTGNILITTRYTDVAESLAYAFGEEHRVIELQTLQVEDAINLFCSTSKVQQDMDGKNAADIKEIIKSIGYLPLAIDQAASFTRASRKQPAQVLSIYKDHEHGNIFQWENSLTRHEAKSVAICFEPILNGIEQSSPMAWNLLHMMTFLDPDSISMKMIEHGLRCFLEWKSSKNRSLLRPKVKYNVIGAIDQGWYEIQTLEYVLEVDEKEIVEDIMSLKNAFQSPIESQQIIAVLENASLLRLRNEGASTYWMHDLVHSLLRHRFARTGISKWLRIAICLVTTVFDHTPAEYYGFADDYVIHVQRFSAEMSKHNVMSLRLLIAETRRWRYLGRNYRLEEAEELNENILATLKRVLGKKNPQTLLATYNQAQYLHSHGKYDQAYQLITETMAIDKGFYAPNSQTIIRITLLGDLLTRLGRQSEAEELLHKLASVANELLLGDPREAIVGVSNAASVFDRLHKFDIAEGLWTKLLEIKEANLDDENPMVGTFYHHFAYHFYLQDRLQEAVDTMQKSLDIASRLYDPNHTEIKNLKMMVDYWTSLLQERQQQVDT